MSISSEITRITNAVANAYTEAEGKGAEMPASLTVANLAQTIASISGGGGGLYAWEKHSFTLQTSEQIIGTTANSYTFGRMVVYNGVPYVIAGGKISRYANGAFDATYATAWTSSANFDTVVYRDELYMVGGGDGTSVKGCAKFNFNSKSWSALANTPNDSLGCSVVVYNDKIHLIGGSNIYGVANNQHYIYNEVSNTWENSIVLPTASYGHGATIHNNKIFVVAGSQRDKFYTFDGATWETYDLPEQIVQANCFEFAGKLFVLSKNLLYLYNDENNEFVKYAELTEYHNNMGVCVVGKNAISTVYNRTNVSAVLEIVPLELLGYVLSDNENEYPEEGEKGEFFYKKVVSGEAPAKYAWGYLVPTSTIFITMPHNLGFKPNWYIAFSVINSANYTHAVAYNGTTAYINYYRGNVTTQTIGTTQASSSSVYIGTDLITVPRYSSSYSWQTASEVIWACGE